MSGLYKLSRLLIGFHVSYKQNKKVVYGYFSNCGGNARPRVTIVTTTLPLLLHAILWNAFTVLVCCIVLYAVHFHVYEVHVLFDMVYFA